MASISALLKIDEQCTTETIQTRLKNLLERYSAGGVLIGLSGGIDSTVLATMAVSALGSASVHAAYLFDRDSEKKIGSNARQVAGGLNIELQEKDIEPILYQMGIYEPVAMQITRWSRIINRVLHWACTLVLGEHPFVTSLRIGSGELDEEDFRRRFFKITCQEPETAFNLRHVQRRALLEDQAREQKLLLLGAANRTEWLTGWFVKGGIDDLPIQPLKGLYKTQIRQLASFLEIPKEIRMQRPSPDMMRGITDEFAIGMRYDRVDLALDYLEGGIPDKVVSQMGITKKEINHVREMKRLSQWKRTSAGEPPPADGGPTSNLRIG